MLGQMMRTVREAIRPVQINNFSEFARLQKMHAFSHVSAGTMGQARKLATDCLAAVRRAPYGGHDRWLPERLERISERLANHDKRHEPSTGWCTCPNRWRAGDSAVTVGSLEHVSRLLGWEHFVGIEVWTAPDGWMLERLESLDEYYEAIRHHGRLRAFNEGSILRHESRGGITFG